MCAADTVRLAVFGTELSRKGPGLLLRDILRGEDPQIDAVVATIHEARADILLLTGIDYDRGGAALQALRDRLTQAGSTFPYGYAVRPNTGRPTGFDLDGDGRRDRAGDAHGWGLYNGQGGMALLSAWPLDVTRARDLTDLLWTDLPGAVLPISADGTPFYQSEVLQTLRLTRTAQWDVPVLLSGGRELRILGFAAGPPVFDGPEDRNGLRNAAEIAFWQAYLDGAFGPPPTGAWALIGHGNMDPIDGEGRHEVLAGLLADPRLQDPMPRSNGALAAANPGHEGDPALDTVDWWEDKDGPGNLRVTYILPAAEMTVVGSGVQWSDPAIDPTAAARETQASRHRLVWVDVALP